MKQTGVAKFCGIWICAWVLAGALAGQTASTGALTGIITDPSGAVIPNATVTVTNITTNQARNATTGPNGTYRFSLLATGDYRVRIAATGFLTVEIPSVHIVVTETVTLNQTVDVGTQRQEVTVQAETELVQTENATVGSVVQAKEITELPLSTRNYTNLLSLEAGANAGVNNASNLGKGALDTAVNGGGTGQNDYKMDGVSVSVYGGTGQLVQQGSISGIGVPNPDTIQEFKIQTSQYDAGYGRNPGASVNIVTKSGTNTFHGTAFEFFRNTVLNANDFFLKASELARGKSNTRGVLNQNQFGGVLGGPIKKNKLFFFASYQELRQINGVAANGSGTGITLPPVPSGDRSAPGFVTALGATACAANHVGDPRYATFRGGKQVACDGVSSSATVAPINPVALKILQVKNADGTYYIPGSGSGAFQPGVAYSIPARDTEHQLLTNGDWVISSKHTFSVRNFWAQEPQVLSFACIGPGCLPGTPANQKYGWDEGVAKVTSVLTNTLVNEARASLQRNTVDGDDKTPATAASVGIQSIGSVATPTVPVVPDLPVVSLTGLFTSGGGPIWDQFVHTTQTEFADQISWNHGKHNIRAGFEYLAGRWDWTFRSLSRGSLNFDTFPDFLLGLSGAQNGTAFSNIASCVTFCVVPSTSEGVVHNYRVTQGSAFIQDDFKVARRLTLNLGLRWEYDGLPTDAGGNLTNINLALIRSGPTPGLAPATGILNGWQVASNYTGTLPAGVVRNSHPYPTQSDTPLNNFAPRAGFAWQPLPTNRFVVRGGAGIFYDAVGGNSFAMAFEQTPPYGTTIALANQDNVNATWANPYQYDPSYFVNNFPLRWANTSNSNPAPGVRISSGINQQLFTANWNTPTTYAYNMSIQYGFLPSWLVEIGYSGSHGIHQLVTQGQNLAQLASPANPVNGITSFTVANASLRVPYLGFGAGNQLAMADSNGDYTYNALLTTIRKRMSHGVTFQGAYTYARARTDQTITNDPTHIKDSYGPNTAYRPHRFTFTYGWDLPFGKPRGLVGKLTSGWNLSGVIVVQDGTPMTLTDNRGGSIYGTVTSRAQLSGNAAVASSGDLKQRLGGIFGGTGYFNPAAFAAPPAVGNGTGFGNTGVGILLGPGQFNWDTAILKSTTVGGIRETAILQFRMEMFNTLNHPQFSNPALNAGAPNFGQITSSSVNPRLIQFALKYIF